MQPHKTVIAAGDGHGETDEFRKRRLPDRALAGCDRRLVVLADYPGCAARGRPFRRIPEEAGACQEHPDGAATHTGRPRHPENRARLRWQRVSGISADAEGTRRIPDPGRLAAMERGVRRAAG